MSALVLQITLLLFKILLISIQPTHFIYFQSFPILIKRLISRRVFLFKHWILVAKSLKRMSIIDFILLIAFMKNELIVMTAKDIKQGPKEGHLTFVLL
jgi:hypothetical protein